MEIQPFTSSTQPIDQTTAQALNQQGEQLDIQNQLPDFWAQLTQQATSIAKDANGASQGQISKWVWPGIPLIFTGIKFLGWIFGKGRR